MPYRLWQIYCNIDLYVRAFEWLSFAAIKPQAIKLLSTQSVELNMASVP